MPAIEMLHEVDPKEAILDRVKDVLPKIRIFGSDCLVAIYRRPEKTKSGLILSDTTRDEDRWQGKSGLLLKMGPTAYLNEEGEKFRDIELYSWVVFRPSDGWPVTLNTMKTALSRDNTVECRIITDINLRMDVDHPDYIY